MNLKKTLTTCGWSLWIYYAVQFAVSFLGSLFLGVLIGLLAATLGPLAAAGLQVRTMPILLFAATVASGLIGCLFVSQQARVSLKQLPLKKDFNWLDLPVGFFLLLAVSLLFGLVLMPFGLNSEELGAPDFAQALFASPLLSVLTIGILGPILEEFFFRGFLFEALNRYNCWFAMVATSAMFAILHLNLGQAIPTFFMGMVLVFFRMKTRSLLCPIGMHILNNCTALLGMNETGQLLTGILILLGVIAGVIWLILHWKVIWQFYAWARQGRPSPKIFFTCLPIALFLVLFVVMSIGGML